jgi:hypothetical protein
VSGALTTERAARTCRVVLWTPWPFPNASLIGHVTIAFAGGWVVHKVPVFRKADDSLSIGTPSAAEIDADGKVRLRDGKRDYKSVITFENAAARERWQHTILAALTDAGIGREGPP